MPGPFNIVGFCHQYCSSSCHFLLLVFFVLYTAKHFAKIPADPAALQVSLVDESGKHVPDQNGQRGISPCPVLIRKGLDVDKITNMMSQTAHG